ncbi:MAG: hypothetical protein IJ815_00540 [Lachnospiraceae bacterium]|nr:hypothetical protein [Lachnospiraceae bacterium]
MSKGKWFLLGKVKPVSYACVLALGISVTGCGAQKQAEEPDLTVAVKTIRTEKGSLEKESVYIGQIENTESVELVCRVSGTVEQVNASVGEHVPKDFVLAHFEDSPAKIELDGAKTAVNSAKKSQESAQKGLETAQANYNSTVTKGTNALNSEHDLADYQKGMSLQTMEADIAYWSDKIATFRIPLWLMPMMMLTNTKRKRRRQKIMEMKSHIRSIRNC